MQEDYYNRLTLIFGALAGAVTVTTSSDPFDLTDTIIGIILLTLMLPVSKWKNTYERIIISMLAGLNIFLILGVAVDYLKLSEDRFEIGYFLVWLFSSTVSFFFLKVQKFNNERAQ